MFGECHAHIFMNGRNYQKAVETHQDKPDEEWIRSVFDAYRDCGITYVRDGGDCLGVSAKAKELAAEYGIEYRTPIFAIHKKGHYGGIVGCAFENMDEYAQLVKQAKKAGADFIKIMTTGIMDFSSDGAITGTALTKEEVTEMVHIAHEKSMAVMSHTNGDAACREAIEAGVDSLEHGNFMGRETLELLAKRETVWVPTLVTIKNLIGMGRYSDVSLHKILDRAEKNVVYAWEQGAKIALGSDAGAVGVMHGEGVKQEYEEFYQILGSDGNLDERLRENEELIRKKFK